MIKINDKIYRFKAILHKVDKIDGAYVIFPFDLKKEFNVGRLKVDATFNGVYYRGSIVNMGVKDKYGNICYIIGLNKNIRKQIGKTFGDEIDVTIKSQKISEV